MAQLTNPLRKTRTRSRKRRRNPTGKQVAIGAAVGVGVLALGYGAYRLVHRETHKKLPSRPRPTALPLPPMTGTGAPAPASGAVGDLCTDVSLYPGFTWTGTSCKPSKSTPPGIYIIDSCRDFIFVAGDNGPQPTTFDAMIHMAIDDSLKPEAKSADPAVVVTAFLTEFWPQCSWPPAPNAPARIVQMFMALSFMVGRYIILGGGRVLGTSSPDIVDEQVAEELKGLGYFDFHPELVPELELPELPEGIAPIPAQPLIPLPPGGEGPGQGGGVVGPQSVPGQGLVGPGQGPVQPKPLKKCQTTPYNPPIRRDLDLPPAWWSKESSFDIKIFDFDVDDFSDCKEWSLRFGFCMWPNSGQLYGALNPDNPMPDTIFRIRNEDNSGIDWSQFTWNPLYKNQYQLKAALQKGKAVIIGGSTTSNPDGGVDPCIGKDLIWPHPTTGRFLVVADWHAEPRFRETIWKPRPHVSFKTQGRKVIATIIYTGMPQFLTEGPVEFGGIGELPDYLKGQAVADTMTQTSFRMDYKVWGIGGWK